MLNQSQSNQNRSNQNEVKHVPAETGPAYCGTGDRITFLITGAETGGAFFMAEVSVAPGGGPPSHVHSREDESFYLQQWTLAVQVGGKALNLSAGDFVHMPSWHNAFLQECRRRNRETTNGGHAAGTRKLLRGVFFPAADIADIPQIGEGVIGRAMKTAPKYGLELLPPAAKRQ
jgi:quercetin dioxygenase-like cupin family protein